MERQHIKAEVVVPKTHAWWTLLALSADLIDQVDQVGFVRNVSRAADVVIVDAAMIDRIIGQIGRQSRVIVILWDGYQSYLDYERAINEINQRVLEVEIRAVGDPAGWGRRPVNQCRVLFSQRDSLYNGTILSPERMKIISFPGLFTKLSIVHRPFLISSKVLLQMTRDWLWIEYMRTKYIFCGQSGLGTLHRYCRRYGIDPDECLDLDGGIRCEKAFLVRWVAAILRNKSDWTSPIVSRALLRLIALRALVSVRSADLFLNIFPKRNLNAYQAGVLFKRHVFLEFGGINGDEVIYPRTADLAFHSRKSIRFERESAMQQMRELAEDDSEKIACFIAGYEAYVVSQLERDVPFQAIAVASEHAKGAERT